MDNVTRMMLPPLIYQRSFILWLLVVFFIVGYGTSFQNKGGVVSIAERIGRKQVGGINSEISKLQYSRKWTNTRIYFQRSPKEIETATNIWQSRRSMTKGWIKFLKSLKDLRYQYFPPSVSNSTSSVSETEESKTKLASEEPDALTLVSILGIFLIPLILRFGSRFTLAELVGLNFLDEKLIAQLNSFITFFQSLGQEKFLLLFAGWFLAKLTCIDYLSIILAIGSGILLENVWVATITSILCSTIASFLLFTAARSEIVHLTCHSLLLTSLLFAGCILGKMFKRYTTHKLLFLFYHYFCLGHCQKTNYSSFRSIIKTECKRPDIFTYPLVSSNLPINSLGL